MRRVAISAVLVALAAVWIGWPQPVLSHVTTTNTVLFDREVVGILNRHCMGCHAADGLASSLGTYEDTWLRRQPVLTAVLAGHMPPWAAVPGYGEFANDNALTLRETQSLISWVEGLGPRNAGRVFLNVPDAASAPRADVRPQPPSDRWQVGQPDLERRLAASTIAPDAGNVVERTVVDLGLTSERRVRALEFMPGDRRVVRAAFFTLEETGQWLGSWTPWHGFVRLPADVAYRLPAGSRVIAEIHYRGANEPVVEAGTLGLYFATQPPPGVASDLVIDATGEVRAGADAQRFHAETLLDRPTYVLSLRPETARGVTSLEVSARRPDGGTDILLFAKDIPTDWPTPYIFKTPLALPAGATLSVTTYDANPTSDPQPGGVRLTVSRYQ
jgi:hypothetical protein